MPSNEEHQQNVLNFAEMAASLPRYFEREKYLTARVQSLEAQKDVLETEVRRLKNDLRRLEKQKGVFTALDEEILFDNDAVIEFKRRLTGGRKVTIRGFGRPIEYRSAGDEAFLHDAIQSFREKATGAARR